MRSFLFARMGSERSMLALEHDTSLQELMRELELNELRFYEHLHDASYGIVGKGNIILVEVHDNRSDGCKYMVANFKGSMELYITTDDRIIGGYASDITLYLEDQLKPVELENAA